MDNDIRDKVQISSEDIAALNFIRDSGRFVFRKHFRQGLRSRIMEVLDRRDVRIEEAGKIVNEIRCFPRARPLFMLRIFITRFNCLEDALQEAGMFKIIEKYLGVGHIAVSDEFVVDYIRAGRRDILLCGLQEYVEGEILDPWGLFPDNPLVALVSQVLGKSRGSRSGTRKALARRVYENTDDLIRRLRTMIIEANYIPDLSGFGNLILTPSGNIKLVDINNICPVSFGDDIPLDDKGYPACDKSIEVLAILEQKLLRRPLDMKDAIYRIFLDPGRMRKVNVLEKKFKAEFTA